LEDSNQTLNNLILRTKHFGFKFGACKRAADHTYATPSTFLAPDESLFPDVNESGLQFLARLTLRKSFSNCVDVLADLAGVALDLCSDNEAITISEVVVKDRRRNASFLNDVVDAHRRLAARVDGSDGEIKDFAAIVISHAVTLRPPGRRGTVTRSSRSLLSFTRH
jgi:hypothetical protein